MTTRDGPGSHGTRSGLSSAARAFLVWHPGCPSAPHQDTGQAPPSSPTGGPRRAHSSESDAEGCWAHAPGRAVPGATPSPPRGGEAREAFPARTRHFAAKPQPPDGRELVCTQTRPQPPARRGPRADAADVPRGGTGWKLGSPPHPGHGQAAGRHGPRATWPWDTPGASCEGTNQSQGPPEMGSTQRKFWKRQSCRNKQQVGSRPGPGWGRTGASGSGARRPWTAHEHPCRQKPHRTGRRGGRSAWVLLRH